MTDSENSTEISVSAFENGLSYMSVPGPPLSPLTLGQLVDEAARKWPNSEYLYVATTNVRLTYAQLKNEVDFFASGLLKMGMNRGDRIGIFGPNSSRWIITFLAAAKVGVVIVPLNTNYEAPELLYALNNVSIKCLVLGEPAKTRDFYKILKGAIPDMKISKENDEISSPIVSSILAPHLTKLVYIGNERLDGTCLWTEVQMTGKADENVVAMKSVAVTVQFDDILCVLFTSGTTGRPKGAMVSHHSVVNGGFRTGRHLYYIPQDRHCLMLPLCHIWGLQVGIFYPICSGSCVVIPSSTFSPSAAITTAAKEKCTWLYGSPTMFSDMMNVPGSDLLDLSSLRAAVIGGASYAKTLLADMKTKLKIPRVVAGYGSTEAFLFVHLRFEDPEGLIFTCVGYPMENTEIKIVNGRGQIVPVGETGEICCRTFGLMRGYWEDSEKTREAIDSARWFHTRDAGYFLESGHLVLAGRLTDMLIRGGENIYPKEIEDFLYQSLEIEEGHVFGVSDKRLGEVAAAWILPKSKSGSKSGVTMDTDHVKAVCVGKISRSKVPVYVKILQTKDDFPRTSVGKAQKSVMQQQYEKELGLNQSSINYVKLDGASSTK